MKAEHRKELQTNLLADRMGRLIQNVKTKPSRSVVLYVVLALAVVLGVVIFVFIRGNQGRAEQERWITYDEITDLKKLEDFGKDNDLTQQGKSARMTVAWFLLWERGVKVILIDPSAKDVLAECRSRFDKLAEDCKEDPILAAEALYGLAVIEETLACTVTRDKIDAQLDLAEKAFTKVTTDFPKTGFGVLADKRAAELSKKEDRERIKRFYQRAQIDVTLNIQAQMLGHPDFGMPKKKK